MRDSDEGTGHDRREAERLRLRDEVLRLGAQLVTARERLRAAERAELIRRLASAVPGLSFLAPETDPAARQRLLAAGGAAWDRAIPDRGNWHAHALGIRFFGHAHLHGHRPHDHEPGSAYITAQCPVSNSPAGKEDSLPQDGEDPA